MISKAKLKYIKSLQVKKYRNEEQCFLIEGAKSVKEIIQSDFQILAVVGVANFLEKELQLPLGTIEVIECTESELASIGSFQTNEAAIAIAKMKPTRKPAMDNKLLLALDDIRDPGNLGTIIRTADWYGIRSIIASEQTADFYNPKVITASMGSFTRMNVYYTDLFSFLSESKRPVYGAFLDGNDVHTKPVEKGGIIVIGNEAHGISALVETQITERITIPRYGKAESLNAAIATAIILDNVLRLQK